MVFHRTFTIPRPGDCYEEKGDDGLYFMCGVSNKQQRIFRKDTVDEDELLWVRGLRQFAWLTSLTGLTTYVDDKWTGMISPGSLRRWVNELVLPPYVTDQFCQLELNWMVDSADIAAFYTKFRKYPFYRPKEVRRPEDVEALILAASELLFEETLIDKRSQGIIQDPKVFQRLEKEIKGGIYMYNLVSKVCAMTLDETPNLRGRLAALFCGGQEIKSIYNFFFEGKQEQNALEEVTIREATPRADWLRLR